MIHSNPQKFNTEIFVSKELAEDPGKAKTQKKWENKSQ